MAEMTGGGTCFEWHGEISNPVIVLIHGLGLNQHMWQWQLPALTGRYRVLTYDLYGHGNSADPAGVPDLTLFSEQLFELLEQQKVGRCAVAGFSLGGMIARRFAMDHGGHLSALAILNSAHLRTKDEQDAILARVTQARANGPAETIEAALVRWFGDDFRKANPQVMDQIRRWVLANNKNVYPGIYQVLADGVTEIASPANPPSCPVLVMTGSQDYGNSPEMSKTIAAEIPGAKLVILDGLRHMGMAEDPKTVNAELTAFLDEALL
jgi:pimeloyl-ACP methyl ester carboxylesterase